MTARSWLLFLLVALVFVLAILGFWGWRRDRASGRISASPAAAPVPPRTVLLPEESGPEERHRRRRTGETQTLDRRTVQGRYRPIDDRGAASEVQGRKEQ